MNKINALTLGPVLALGFLSLALVQTNAIAAEAVTVTVMGESWDGCSRGFAYYLGLTEAEREMTSARRGSRVSVDGRPDIFTITNPGPEFELTFTTTEPTFRLIVEGDRFPLVITQPIDVPDGGGAIDIGRIDAPRAEGPEHTWPLEKAATALGYATPAEMLADNNAAIRLLVLGSGAAGAPEWAEGATISVATADSPSATSVPKTTNSPYLLRVSQDSYVFPFDMDRKNTFFLMTEPPVGAFIIVVPFPPDAESDKDVTISITDHEVEELLDPPRPWIYDPLIVSVRNGFSTSTIRVNSNID